MPPYLYSNITLTNSTLLFTHYELQNTWIFKLIMNVSNYGIIFICGYLFGQLIIRSSLFSKSSTSLGVNILKLCIYGSQSNGSFLEETSNKKYASQEKKKIKHRLLNLTFCFLGLQISYILWGLLQEKIMTQVYTEFENSNKRFHNSQFLVFMNRIFSFIFAVVYLIIFPPAHHFAPLYKYSYSSLSNILSSWCQYEALKYVLGKSCKVIPVMIMGTLISGTHYPLFDYLTAGGISLGMMLFLLESQEFKENALITTTSGLILLITYLVFDSFTSNWQGKLFKQYQVTYIQMMAGINGFSVLFTIMSLIQQGQLISSFGLFLQSSEFGKDCLILSLCSTTGQLFIFYTISEFGPVTFTIIMTIRQCFSVILSCILYNHPINQVGIIGVIILFLSVFLRIYSRYFNK